jgi:hypothetical protein
LCPRCAWSWSGQQSLCSVHFVGLRPDSSHREFLVRNRPSRDGDLDGDDLNLMFAQYGLELAVVS